MIKDSYKIDPTAEYGAMIELTCKHHPNLTWTTKNIDMIGARRIFFHNLETDRECDCSVTCLILKPKS